MVFKRHDWIKYGIGSFRIEIVIKEDYREIDKFNCNNKEDFKRILEILKLKYGFG